MRATETDRADLSLLIDAARAAGEIALFHHGKTPRVWEKDAGQGPVTEADLEVDAMLRDNLMAARPDYGWLSEETPDDGARLDKSSVFIADPIDGTRAFIDGRPDFAHALAVARDGLVTAAVVYLPARDRLYSAAWGQGARLNGAAISISARAEERDATTLTARRNLMADRWPGGVPPVKPVFRSSLAYRMALVAEGRFDSMMSLHPTWEWDAAAGALLVTEAGGRVAGPDGAAPRFNSRSPRLSGVLAGPGPLVEAFLRRLQRPARRR